MRKVFVFIMLLCACCLFFNCSDNISQGMTIELSPGYPNITYYPNQSHSTCNIYIKIHCPEENYTLSVLYGEEGYRSSSIYNLNTIYYNLNNHCYTYGYSSNTIPVSAFSDYSSFLATQLNGESSLSLSSITKEQWEEADSAAGYAAGHYKDFLRELFKKFIPMKITCIETNKNYEITSYGPFDSLLRN